MNWNKYFFGSNSEEEEDSGYTELVEQDEACQRANIEGYKKGLDDGYYCGHQIGYEEASKKYEKIKKIRNRNTLIMAFFLSFGCIICGIWIERKWGRKK